MPNEKRGSEMVNTMIKQKDVLGLNIKRKIMGRLTGKKIGKYIEKVGIEKL